MSPKSTQKSNIKLFGIPVNQQSVVRWKIYFDRARMYIGYISFVMIAFVFLNSVQSELVRGILDEHRLWIYPAVVIVFVIISLPNNRLLGRLDSKLGMRKEELRNYATANPVTMEILESLREIKENQQILLEKENSHS